LTTTLPRTPGRKSTETKIEEEGLKEDGSKKGKEMEDGRNTERRIE
jgi:hypothetical protein